MTKRVVAKTSTRTSPTTTKAAASRTTKASAAGKTASAASKAKAPASKAAKKATAQAAPMKAGAAATGGIAWTKRQRARVYAPRHPHPLDREPPDGATAWSALQDFYGSPRLAPMPTYAEHRAANAMLDQVRQEMSQPTPPAETTAERESLRHGLLSNEGEASGSWGRVQEDVIENLVAFWVAQYGLRRAAELMFAPVILQAVTRHTEGTGAKELRRAYVYERFGPSDSLARGLPHYWLHLRRHLARAPGSAREALAGLVFPDSQGAEKWGDRADRQPKHEAAVLHGDEEATRRLALEEMEQSKQPSHGSIILFHSLTDPEMALRFAQAQPMNFATAAGPFAFQLVDNLGAKAAPVLLALLERVSSGPDARRALAQAAVLADADHCRQQAKRLEGALRTELQRALG